MFTKTFVFAISPAVTGLVAAQTQVGRFVDLGAVGGAYIGRASVAEHGARTLVPVSGVATTLWNHAMGSSVFTPPGPQPTLGSSAYGPVMDALGEVIAYTSLPLNGGAIDVRAQRWTAALGVQNLPAPPGGTGVATTSGISGDGSFVVGSFEHSGFNGFSDPTAACAWDAAGQPMVLGELPGGEDSGYALAASHDGSVIVGNCSVRIESNIQGVWSVSGGFVWTSATGIQAIAQTPEEFFARGVSGDGNVLLGVGLGPISGLPAVALRRVQGQPIEELLGPQGSSYPLATNHDGSVIIGQTTGGSVIGYPLYTGAFLWREGIGAAALEDELAAAGVLLPSGFTVTDCITLSPEGDAVLGIGTDAQNVVHAWLAYLAPPALEFGTLACDPAHPNSTGSAASLTATGFGYASGPGFELLAQGLPPGMACMMLASQLAGFTALPGGSQGDLCLGGSIGRFNTLVELQFADPFGRARLAVDLAMMPQPGGRVPLLAGETWHFQAWYRDSNPSPTSNWTSAVSDVFEP